MEQRKNIDTSLKERHKILHLLQNLERDNITFDELEEIGFTLKKAAGRALPPLVRRLWREKSGSLISKYAYLLDFFDDDTWIDQLIQITLRRRDLNNEGKAALLALLEGYGVDIRVPPFTNLLADLSGPLSETLPRLLDSGDDGLILFMEDFLSHSQDGQLELIRAMARLSDPRIPGLLEILLWFDSPAIVQEVVSALGKIRIEAAAVVLQNFAAHADSPTLALIERNLRRLAFLGINIPPSSVSSCCPPIHATYITPLDGAGYYCLWFSRFKSDGKLTLLYLQVHESSGIRGGWGSGNLTVAEYDGHLAETCKEDNLLAVAPDYALALLRDALHRNRTNLYQLPAEFYLFNSVFRGLDITPTVHKPAFPDYDPARFRDAVNLVASSDELLDDDFFAGWFIAKGRVCDFAEEWNKLELAGAKKSMFEEVLARFCTELLTPELDSIRNRLLVSAEMMLKTGRERGDVEQALATAASLESPPVLLHRHPFVRRFALESISMAREALTEGYDLRQYDDEDEFWE